MLLLLQNQTWVPLPTCSKTNLLTLGYGADVVFIAECRLLLLFSHQVMSSSLKPSDNSSPGSFVHGIFQAKKQEWVAIFFSRRSWRSKIKPVVPALAWGFFTAEPLGKP